MTSHSTGGRYRTYGFYGAQVFHEGVSSGDRDGDGGGNGAGMTSEGAFEEHFTAHSAPRITWRIHPERKETVGGNCTGSVLLPFGNCGAVLVGGRHVKQRCYAPTTRNLGAKALKGRPGICRIAKGSPCSVSRQCRPGTVCTHPSKKQGAGPVEVCQEPTVVLWAGAMQGDKFVAALVRTMVAHLRADTRDGSQSGARSIFARTPFAADVLDQVEASFSAARVVDTPASSASGATFVSSGDGLFIAKLVREGEFFDMEQHLFKQLEDSMVWDSADFVQDHCPTPAGAKLPGNCWARFCFSRYVINLPVLSFRHFDDMWIVIPAAAPLRALALTGSASSRPYGEPEYFDVKPMGARSKQRPAFFHALADLDFAPLSGAALRDAQPASEQWTALMGKLACDASFLGPGQNDRPFVDYSLLFEVYAPAEPVVEPGPNCVSARQCFEERPSQPCKVICVSIIDYFLRYDTFLQLVESKVINEKWDDYDTKVTDMISCIGHLSQAESSSSFVGKHNGGRYDLVRLPEDKEGKEGKADRQTLVSLHSTSKEGTIRSESHGEVVLKFRPGKDDVHRITILCRTAFPAAKRMKCLPYLQLACDEVGPLQSFSTNTYLSWASCTFHAPPDRASACKMVLAEACQERLGREIMMVAFGRKF